jgi:hypothetical protein
MTVAVARGGPRRHSLASGESRLLFENPRLGKKRTATGLRQGFGERKGHVA